jgi:putative hydrolase of the HAD superfamily
MLSTIIFDLDDTLYDEIEYCRSGLHSIADFLAESIKTVTTEQLFNAFWAQFTAGNRTKTFNTALDELNISYDDKLINCLITVYRNHVPKITLPQDSRDVLEQLREKYKLALLTDGFLPAQRLKVQALGIEEYFSYIVYTEQLGREFWKPSPVGFEKIIEYLNQKPGNISFVADNEEKDFIAPNMLGFLTIQIVRPARIHTKPSQQQPYAAAQYTIIKISQLPHLLDRLTKA